MIRFFIYGALVVFNFSAAAGTIVAQQSFSEYEGLGLQPGGGNGTLDSAQWQISGASSGDSVWSDTVRAGDLARGLSSGRVRGGGVYAFSLPGNKRGLGVQATSSDFTPGALTWSVTNQTTQSLTDFVLDFELWWLNDGARSTAIETQVSVDRTSWRPVASTSTPITADALGWQFEIQSIAVDAIAKTSTAALDGSSFAAPGDSFWLRWQFDDSAGSGSRDEIALRALRVSARAFDAPQDAAGDQIVTVAAPPTLGCAAFMLVAFATQRRRRLIKSLGPI